MCDAEAFGRRPLRNHKHVSPTGDQMTYTEALMAPMVMVMDRSFPVEALRTHDSLDLRSIGDKAWKVILGIAPSAETNS